MSRPRSRSSQRYVLRARRNTDTAARSAVQCWQSGRLYRPRCTIARHAVEPSTRECLGGRNRFVLSSPCPGRWPCTRTFTPRKTAERHAGIGDARSGGSIPASWVPAPEATGSDDLLSRGRRGHAQGAVRPGECCLGAETASGSRLHATGKSAIHDQRRPGYVFGIVRREEQGSVGGVPRLPCLPTGIIASRSCIICSTSPPHACVSDASTNGVRSMPGSTALQRIPFRRIRRLSRASGQPFRASMHRKRQTVPGVCEFR